MAIWQDVYALDDWLMILKNCKQHDDPNAKELINKLSNLLDEYHNISKVTLKNIPKRQKKLTQIAQLAQEYKDYLGDQFISKEQENVTGDKFPVGFLDSTSTKPRKDTRLKGSIDPWIHGLQQRANKKINYLNKLSEYYKHAHSKYVDKKSLLKTLKTEENKHSKQKFFRLSSGTLLEKQDPVHRPIEFMLEDLKSKRNTAEYPMNIAFYQWVETKTKVPFFLWLEKHPISTTTRDISTNWRGSYKNKMGPVNYESPENVSVHIEDVDGDYKLMAKKLNSKNIFELNTSKLADFVFKVGCPLGAAAFIWDAKDKNHFYTHIHESGIYHHSTMTSGKKVRCAGMWLVEHGKITAIDNNSGHYKPTSLSFYKLICLLHDKNLLHPNAQIADLRRPKRLKDKNNIFKGYEDNYTNLKSYLEWAEDLPEIKKYLHKKNIQPLSERYEPKTKVMGSQKF
ncbi:hypothetical protein DGG96_01985 [Legionella qingyii]|uniref:Uncharacterized protein n=2 Tax=Legionella qingyii TaxID=2184757 RepID=A0A317U8J1_9GAMM|nr:hypothetical protein [Legionella qingyii]PWY57508.1 hypothetical protein DGG96_01985 [Legionella qingyii]